MANITVSVTDANNITVQLTPVAAQNITIDRGVAGNGISSIVPVTISTLQYLRIYYTNGTQADVGPLTSTAYFGETPITIVGNTIGLSTVPIAKGGTNAITAAAAIQNLLPSYTGNGSKRLGLNSGATALEWVADGGGTVTSVDVSGGTTGLTTSGGPITGSGTITLAGTLAVLNGGTGVTTSTGTGSVVLSTSPSLVTPLLGTPTSGNFSTGTFTWPTFNQNTTGTAAGLSATLVIASGGTNGTATPTAGAVPYGTGTAYAFTAAGTAGQILQSNGASAPTWANLSSLGVSSFNAGTTGFTPSTATTGAVTLAGTLATTNGGTGLTSFTANGVVYASSTSALATGSALTWNGSALAVTGTLSATDVIKQTGNPSLPAAGATEAFVAHNTGYGAVLYGQGTTYDVALLDRNTTPRLTVTTAGAAVTGTLSATGLVTATAGIVVGTGAGTYTAGSLGFSNANEGFVYRPPLAGAQNAHNFQSFGGTKILGITEAGAVGVFGTFSSTLGATIQGLTVGLGAGAVATNTVVGNAALSGSNTGDVNTAVGYQALKVNTSGQWNTGVGAYALTANQGGVNNTAVGRALVTNVSGADNTAVGMNALYYNTGSNNTAVGSNSLLNTTASNNTAVGYQAGYSNTIGALNNFIGYQAGYSYNHGTADGSSLFCGSRAGYSQTSGIYNTYVGEAAGYNMTTGGKNTIIGRYTGNQGGLDIRTASNYIVLSDGDGNPRGIFDASGNFLIGLTVAAAGSASTVYKNLDSCWTWRVEAGATSLPNGILIKYSGTSPNNTGSQFIYCEDSGNTQRMSVRSNGGIANYSANDVNLSDSREKTNFAPAKSYLDVICAIPVQTFNYIDQNLEEDDGLTLGVIAQDVQAVAPELVMESNWAGKDEPEKMRLSIYQTDLQYALMKCIQELKAEVDSLKAQINGASA